jgi:glycosyltransferase involved in cell wall biosynthesis
VISLVVYVPEVSVVIPTFNYARFLPDAIQSVLNQTFRDLDLVVVDDGSTDDTRAVVARFEDDPRVRYVHQDNQGDSAARNTGIARSTGTYVAFLDSDDYWLPDKIERQVAVLATCPDISVVYTAGIVSKVDARRREISRRVVGRRPMLERTLAEQMLYRHVVTGSHSSVMVRRTALEEVGGFDEALPFMCDHDLWRRLSESHRFHCVDEPLVCIRKHASNTSKRTQLMFDYERLYFAKMVRDIPACHRSHIPKVAVYRFTGWTWRLLRCGRFQAAGAAGWLVLTNARRCPRAVPGILFRLGRARVGARRSGRHLTVRT